MAAVSRANLATFPNSPYAAELQRGGASRSFSPQIEAEYIRARLRDDRTLIRAAAVLAALMTVLRGGERILLGTFNPAMWSVLAVVVTSSLALVGIAWSSAFERVYLRVAQIVVPVRNSLATLLIVQTAAHGGLEGLMIVPLMVLSPFYFMGLRFRTALVTVGATIVAFVAAAALFGLALPIALRALALLLMITVTCAIAARHLEKASRKSFLESHLIEELAQHDTLTGLKNRRVFDEHLDRLWQQGVEEARSLAILMMDIDHFKAYNDRHGHQAGDQTLRRVAQALQTFVTRPLDVLARYGGEEFAVILYDIDAREAEGLAERMRRAVGGLAIKHEGSHAGAAVTISVGVAAIRPSAERKSRGALQLADQALYEAKVRGRNRVELLDDAAHRQLVTGVFSKESFARRQ
jgi:diguanylate cyclase (GGDEF)-like protein